MRCAARLPLASVVTMVTLALLAAFGVSSCRRDSSTPTHATAGTFELTPKTLSTGADNFTGLPAKWRFKIGDDPRWAEAGFDDGAWKTLAARMPEGLPGGGQKMRTVWLRLELSVAKPLRGRTLAILVAHFEPLELFIDGRRVATFEKLEGWGDHPRWFRFDRAKHTLALRFRTRYSAELARIYGYSGVSLSISTPKTVRWWTQLKATGRRLHYFAIGLASAMALIHLLLFFFIRREERLSAEARGDASASGPTPESLRVNIGAAQRQPLSRARSARASEASVHLYHAIAILGVVIMSYASITSSRADSATSLLGYTYVFTLSLAVAALAGLRMIYALYSDAANAPYGSASRRWWVFLLLIAPIALLGQWTPRWLLYLAICLLLLDQTMVLLRALLAGSKGALTIAFGALLWVGLSTMSMLADMRVLSFEQVPPYVYLYGFLALIGSVSITLARGAARDQRGLVRQLSEIRELSEATLEQQRELSLERVARQALEAETARKALQLEEAEKRAALRAEMEQVNLELRNATGRLVQSEKMAALGGLVAGVAHEVNTPMGAIRSMQDSLSRALSRLSSQLEADHPELAADPAVAEPLARVASARQAIAHEADRIDEIVRRLRSFARLDQASLKSVDVAETIDDALALARHQIGPEVQVTRDVGELPPLRCYPRQLGQLFLHLLVNAAQALDGSDDGSITVAARHEGDEIIVRVSDNGPGIPAELRAHVFEPRVSHRGGAGLGLAICRRIASEHGGTIELISTADDAGATFELRLPIDGAKA